MLLNKTLEHLKKVFNEVTVYPNDVEETPKAVTTNNKKTQIIIIIIIIILTYDGRKDKKF